MYAAAKFSIIALRWNGDQTYTFHGAHAAMEAQKARGVTGLMVVNMHDEQARPRRQHGGSWRAETGLWRVVRVEATPVVNVTFAEAEEMVFQTSVLGGNVRMMVVDNHGIQALKSVRRAQVIKKAKKPPC